MLHTAPLQTGTVDGKILHALKNTLLQYLGAKRHAGFCPSTVWTLLTACNWDRMAIAFKGSSCKQRWEIVFLVFADKGSITSTYVSLLSYMGFTEDARSDFLLLYGSINELSETCRGVAACLMHNPMNPKTLNPNS